MVDNCPADLNVDSLKAIKLVKMLMTLNHMA